MKKKPDYSNSAVNLVNPPEVGEQLLELQDYQKQITLLTDLLRENETYQLLEQYQQKISDLTAQIKAMVDAQGSYQDLEQGYYGLKYRRVSKSYEAVPFIANYPKYSPAVIVNAVNVEILEALIKGGLLVEEELKQNGVLQESHGYAYIVKVVVE